jgi:WD40 repeat protein
MRAARGRPSGVGKSSFALAGLLPRLREQGPWVVLKLRPGRDPFGTLGTRLAAAERLSRGQASGTGAFEESIDESVMGEGESVRASAGASPEQRAARLREVPGALALTLARLAERQRCNVLLFVDQLEEVVTLVDDEHERRAFVEAICGAADDVQGAVRVVFTMREEFLARLALGPQAAQVLTSVQVLTSPGPEALRDILERPVAAVGYGYEDRSIVAGMVEEVGGEITALPLAQFAGARLWERRDRRARQLTVAAYRELGGVAGALAHHADSVLAALAPSERRLARQLLLRLVTPEGTRRVVTRAELCDGLPPAAQAVLARLSEARLLSARQALEGEEGEGDGGEGDDQEVTVELVHESLIVSWDRLRRWLEEGREELRFLAEVGQAAKLWEDRGARDDEAWGDEALAEAERQLARVATEEVPTRVRRFIEVGRRLEAARLSRLRRRRRVGLALAVGIPLVIAVAATSVALLIAREQRATERERRRAEAQRAAVQRESARAAIGRGDVLEARARLRASLTTRDSTLGRALWQRLQAEPLLWRRRLGSRLYGLALAPDGRRLALAAADGSIYLLDTRESAVVQVLRGHVDQVFSVAFSPDGSQLASGAWDGELRLWRLADGTGSAIARFSGAVSAVAFSPDGELLAAGSWDKTARLFFPRRKDAPEVKGALPRQAKRIDTLAFSPDGKRLATGGHDAKLRVFALDAAKRHQGAPLVLAGHRGAIYAAIFSRDGKRLISGAADATIRIWDATTGALERMLLGHRSVVWSLALAPDGKTFASGSWDKDLRVWRFPDGKLLRRLAGHREVVSSVAFSPDGKRLYSCSRDRTARAWRVLRQDHRRRQRRGHEGHEGSVLAVAVSPDGSTIASGGQDGALRLWSVRSGRELAALRGHEGAIHALAFVGSSTLASGGQDGKLRLWSTTTRKTIRVMHGHRGTIWSLASLPNKAKKKLLVSAGADRTLRIWDVGAGSLRRVLHAHRGEVMAVCVSKGGELLASGGADRTVRLWSREGAPLARLRGHKDVVSGLAFAGSDLLSTGLDGRVQRWTLRGVTSGVAKAGCAGGAPIEINLGDDPSAARLLVDLGRGRAYSLAVSPDGRHVAMPSSDGLLRLVDLDSGRRQQLAGHTAEVNAVAFSPKGDRLVSASDDRSLRVWLVASGRPYWRASSLLLCADSPSPQRCASQGPRVHTHRGWRWLRSGKRSPGPRGERWREAMENGRLVRVAPAGRHLCQLTFDGRLKVWQRVPAQGPDAVQLRFDWPRPQTEELLAVPGGCVARSKGGVVERFDLDGSRRRLVAKGATAMVYQRGVRVAPGSSSSSQPLARGVGIWVAADGAVLAFNGARREILRLRVSKKGGAAAGRAVAGPTALARIGELIAVGYRDGTVELHRYGGGAGRWPLRRRGRAIEPRARPPRRAAQHVGGRLRRWFYRHLGPERR